MSLPEESLVGVSNNLKTEFVPNEQEQALNARHPGPADNLVVHATVNPHPYATQSVSQRLAYCPLLAAKVQPR